MMATEHKVLGSRRNQSMKSRRPSKPTPSGIQLSNSKTNSKAKAVTTESPSSRSPSYSPPPVVAPRGPKATPHRSAPDQKTSSQGKRHRDADSKVSGGLAQHILSPVAPWNEHQSGSQTSPHASDSVYEEEASEGEIEQDLLEGFDSCDNYRCYGLHGHNDCPLEKCCWGCRSSNHFWTECPMTCKECGSPGHIPKYCHDFKSPNDRGVAYPRELNTQRQPDLPDDKMYTCDNYGCRGMHSHSDCPLPTVCWGCRATDHWWSRCKAQCSKCGRRQHIAKYCGEFDPWREDRSRPKRPPQDIITYDMKRKREQEIERDHKRESSSPPAKKHPIASPLTRERRRSDTDGSIEEERPRERPRGRPTIDSYRPPHFIDSYRPPKSSRVSHDPILPVSTFPVRPPSRPRLDTRIRDKEYCEYWLRNGRCNYMDTPLGCKYSHAIPNPRILAAMGVQYLPASVKAQAGWVQTSMTCKVPTAKPTLPAVRTETKPATKPEPAPIRPTVEPRGLQLTPSATPSSPVLAPSHPHYDPSRISSSPSVPRQNHPVSNSRDRQSSESEMTRVSDRKNDLNETSNSERMKAFEEEEFFKQKRHEAEMKRRRDAQDLEYQHSLKMAELRRR